ncbi:sigma-54-dependent transcriptional regulator [Plebeiibacterium marinum]|uniref:Sigma-54 dependent transcriptional regulator n=1 Tax=Plebeiibacterium marinum TaxID=2992111 RepID=A0AAE3SKX3_9BACT|nr:sigma-54 dependent transcriptional regulator [Plebeiobacterium marinum]MCW3807320.1 sigma-54 dependent transcriptional regulator [Plebeiobacterium marinum]
MQEINILYIDDEKDNLITIRAGLRKWYKIDISESGKEALAKLAKSNYHIVITDQRMPEMSGLELSAILKEKYPDIIVIILTAFDDNKTMLDAINQGGIYRYLLKPVDINDLKLTLDSAIEKYRFRKERLGLFNKIMQKHKELTEAFAKINTLKNQLEEENIQLKLEIGNNEFSEIIGNSKALKKVLGLIKKVSKTDSSILILGESGTGKELFANAIHSNSNRKEKPFIKVNCAAIPENLIESELFGYEKGAFTGAVISKPGKFELANNGTLFLDEIGELPLTVQSKLLRAIQEQEIERLGGVKTKKINIRLISATNRNLEEEVNKGKFREDLYYRLNVMPISVPSLRDRKDDIPLLVHFFMEKFNRKIGADITSISSKALKKLIDYNWPGNVRELENIIERSYILSSGNKLDVDFNFNRNGNSQLKNEHLTLEENERNYILSILKKTRWKVKGESGAAEILNINPSTLFSRMRKLKIEKSDRDDI